MKRILSFILTLLLVFALCACEKNAGVNNDLPISGIGENVDNSANNNDQDSALDSENEKNENGEENEESIHTHTWVNATCIAPKTCSECGKTEGKANGHSWKDADCSNPKTCTVCGATEGEISGHKWTNATCSSPKTCSECGKTEGKANGHSWKDADCSNPKTCTVCGATSGKTAGHTFSNGTCSTCGKSDPDYVSESMVWIPTKGGTKYHIKATCSNMDNPEYVTQKEAETRGFTPCKKCYG